MFWPLEMAEAPVNDWNPYLSFHQETEQEADEYQEEDAERAKDIQIEQTDRYTSYHYVHELALEL